LEAALVVTLIAWLGAMAVLAFLVIKDRTWRTGLVGLAL
jgi:hypothetical protein